MSLGPSPIWAGLILGRDGWPKEQEEEAVGTSEDSPKEEVFREGRHSCYRSDMMGTLSNDMSRAVHHKLDTVVCYTTEKLRKAVFMSHSLPGSKEAASLLRT